MLLPDPEVSSQIVTILRCTPYSKPTIKPIASSRNTSIDLVRISGKKEVLEVFIPHFLGGVFFPYTLSRHLPIQIRCAKLHPNEISIWTATLPVHHQSPLHSSVFCCPSLTEKTTLGNSFCYREQKCFFRLCSTHAELISLCILWATEHVK